MIYLKKGIFLCGLWIAGLVMLYAQSPVMNGFLIEKDSPLQTYNRMIFGQFIEHFHRQIYGGIFEPVSK
jgi:alpha-N-arabinofuranosidase